MKNNKTTVFNILGELKLTGGGTYAFVPEKGETIVGLTNEAEAPINKRIDVDIVDNVLVSYEWVGPVVMAFKEQTRKDICLAYVVKDAADINKAKHAHAKKMARAVELILSLMAHGKWDVTVTPYVIQSDQVFGIYQFRWDHEDVKRQLKEQNPKDWDKHNYWCGMGGFHYTLGGIAYLNSDKAWVWAQEFLSTIIHEISHMLGASHSNSNAGTEYGGWDYMGNSSHILNAHHRCVVGLQDENYIAETEDSGTFFLPPIEVPENDLRNGEHSCIRIRHAGNRYLVASRKAREQHYYGVHKTHADSLEVHRIPGAWRGGPSESVARVPVGEKRAISEGFEIQHDGWHEGVAKVRVIIDGKIPESKDYPSPLVTTHGDPITENHSGLWDNDNYKHQGIDLFVHDGNRITGYWYTYHPHGERGSALSGKNNGKEWFVLDGEIDPETNIISVTIIQTKDRILKEVGYGTLRLSGDQLLFRSYTENYGRDHWALKRTTTPREAPSGLYTSGKFEGYSVAKYRDENKDPIYTVYYYGYSGGNLQWYVYQGDDPKNLVGYSTTGKYKQPYEEELEIISSISIDDVLKHEPVLEHKIS
jgi:hypothetical protein